jgi:hypothetical protein
MRRRLETLALISAVCLLGSCSSGRSGSPTAPSRSTTAAVAATPSASATASAAAPSKPPIIPLAVQPGASGLSLPLEPFGPSVVAFPPRDQSFGFGTALNITYRETLRRSAVSTFVDLEGWIVWVQEYLRYRVNGCSHQDASFRVGVQIGGGGIPPICVEAPPGAVNFPPRDQSFAFGLDLNNTYRDVLRRGAVSAFVDLEGWIVWIQEYLRYRVNNCSHEEASFRVGVQIGGGGVPPTCQPSSGGGGGGGGGTGTAFVDFQTDSLTCNCTVGTTIRLIVDNSQVGTMGCRDSRRVSVSPGSHTVEACDTSGCWPRQTTQLSANQAFAYTLTCTTGIGTTLGGSQKICAQ